MSLTFKWCFMVHQAFPCYFLILSSGKEMGGKESKREGRHIYWAPTTNIYQRPQECISICWPHSENHVEYMFSFTFYRWGSERLILLAMTYKNWQTGAEPQVLLQKQECFPSFQIIINIDFWTILRLVALLLWLKCPVFLYSGKAFWNIL